MKNTEIDVALLQCAGIPDIPEAPVTNKQDAQWKNDLLFAHQDCHSKLMRVYEIQEQVLR